MGGRSLKEIGMRNIGAMAAFVIFTGALAPRVAQAQCRNDNDCKGDRICVDGVCQGPTSITPHVPNQAASVPSSAEAEERGVARAERLGIEIGVRLGYGIPKGAVASGPGSDLSLGIKGMIPVQVEAGYRVIPALLVGAYFQYGFGLLGDTISSACNSTQAQAANMGCSVRDLRLGVQAHYHFLARERLDPWLGLGIGYEWLGFSVSASSQGVSASSLSTIRGFEFVNFQGGLDFSIADHVVLGPVVSLAVGKYSTDSTSSSFGTDTSSDITDPALHYWLILGVRAAYIL